MVFIVNPGSGPINEPTTVEDALANMDVFVADVIAAGHQVRFDPDCQGEDDGRFVFEVTAENGTGYEIEMPGLPLERVRYMDDPDQNIVNFPRLYVNGSSWVWALAINAVVTAEKN